MVVVDKYVMIFSVTWNKLDVSPFKTNYLDLEKVSIVYAKVQYTCKYTAKVYILVLSNSLSVPSMNNNLTPPLIMRESGLAVKDTETIHTMYPSVENHSIYFTNFDTHIILFLHGVLSYFLTSKQSLVTLEVT